MVAFWDAANLSQRASLLALEERSAVMTASPEIQEIAIVTGASTGIGAATARELARRGFHVLAGVRRDRDADAIRGPQLLSDATSGRKGSRRQRRVLGTSRRARSRCR